MTDINATIEEIRNFSPELARKVNRYVKDHSYGLVYEKNLPEAVRYYKRRPQRGNTVNILPERGHTETAENKVPWVVDRVKGDTVFIHHDDEKKELPVSEVVVVAGHDDVIYPGLKVIDKVERGNADDPYHMVINAENYHALEMLSYAYAGKVDCIYIDPPYNTGAKDWKYNNDYVGQDDQYRHSKWLSFMERRLKIAERLLNPDDSVLIVTIDEKEYLRLGMLLEQMFPEARIQMITSVINPSGTMRGNEFSRVEEFLYICRFGNASIIKRSENMLGNDDVSSQSRLWYPFARTNWLRTVKNLQFYPIYINKETKQIVAVGDSMELTREQKDFPTIDGTIAVFPVRDSGEEASWGAIPSTAREWVRKGTLRVSGYDEKTDRWSIQYIRTSWQKQIDNGEIVVTRKKEDGSLDIERAQNIERAVSPKSVWNKKSHNATDYGTYLNAALMSDRKFPYPKSLYAVEDALRFFVADKPNALIVDFFAGSGTTAHATMLLNHLDGGHRRCISVTNNEVSAEEEKKFVKAGLRPYDEEWQKYGIARYITWERVKAAITGVNTLGEPIKGDYKFTEEFPMSEGFHENAIFCELTYESEWDVRLDYAFDAIAPILWMQAGCKGGIITKIGKTFRYTDNYAVLFDYSQASNFVKAVKAHPSIGTVYVVTDDQRQFSDICNRLKSRNIKVHRLYKSYLETFVILGEGYSA